MKLKAELMGVTGKTKHSIGYIENGEPIEMESLPNAKSLEIVETDSGVFLYRYSDSGVCIADTWHLSIDEAIAQAEFEYQIKKTSWYEIG